LKRHYARYTPELVERFCGVPRERFLKIAETFCTASGAEKTGAICYALGWTQQSKGPQIIRAAAILQLLLGNIGRPGGGILALRGHASIQGSTDIPTLYDILPGYLPMPNLGPTSHSLADYCGGFVVINSLYLGGVKAARRLSALRTEFACGCAGLQTDCERRAPMQRYFAALTIVLLLGMVWGRVLQMKEQA
jgi:anaerobic selenocysteine-containing dehydrogenase